MLKLNIIVTLSMMETNQFLYVAQEEHNCHQNRKVANVGCRSTCDQAAVLEVLWCDITDGRFPQPWREMKTKKPKGNEESKPSKVTRPKA